MLTNKTLKPKEKKSNLQLIKFFLIKNFNTKYKIKNLEKSNDFIKIIFLFSYSEKLKLKKLLKTPFATMQINKIIIILSILERLFRKISNPWKNRPKKISSRIFKLSIKLPAMKLNGMKIINKFIKKVFEKKISEFIK